MQKHLFIHLVFFLLLNKVAFAQYAPYPTLTIDSIQYVSDAKMMGTFPNDSSDYINPVFKNTTYKDSIKFEGFVLFDPRLYGLSTTKGRASAVILADTFSRPWGGIEVMADPSSSVFPAGQTTTLPILVNETKFFDNLKPGTKVRITGIMRSFRGTPPAGTRQGQSQVNVLRANQNWDNSVVVLDSRQRSFTPIILSIDSFMTGNANVGQVQKKLSGEKWEGTYVEFKNVSVFTRTASGARWFWSVVNKAGNAIDISDFSGWYRNDATTDSVLPTGRFTPPPIGTNIKFLRGVIIENALGGQYRYTLAPLLPSDIGDTGITNCTISYNGLVDTTVVFKQDSILINAGNGFSKYEWSTGDTARSIWVKSNCFLKVNVFDSLGCSGIDSTRVIFGKGIQQKDTSICPGNNLSLSVNSSVKDGLVAWYPFNGNTIDESGNGNNGLNNGASLTTDRFGENNSAYSFNGISNFIDCGSMMNLGYYPNYLTQSAWFLAPISQTNNNTLPLITRRQLLSNSWFSLVGGGNFFNDTPCALVDIHSYQLGINNRLSTNKSSTDGKWHHILSVKNGNIYSLYFDGKFQKSIVDFSASYGSTSNLHIGHHGAWNNYFQGKIDDIAIYNRALNVDEVNSIYLNGIVNINAIWSTGDTSKIINIAPTTSSTIYCTQKIGSFTLIDSIRVNVFPLPIINTLPDTAVAFKIDSILINAGPGYNKYLWNGGDTNQIKWVKTSGYTKVSVFNNYGCSNSDSTNVIFVKGILNKDSSICKNAWVNLNSINSANGNYLWSTGDTNGNIIKNISNDIVFKCNYKIGSIELEDSVKFSVRSLPSNFVSYSKRGLCSNDTINLIASNGYFYKWYKNKTQFVGTNKIYSAFANGEYKVRITDSTGCVNFSDSIVLFSAPLPKAKISVTDTALCLVGNVFNFTDSTIIDSGTVIRNWNFGNGNTSILPIASQTYPSAANYLVRLRETSNYGCIDSTTKNITVFPNPTAGPIVGLTNSLTAATPYFYSVTQQLNHNYNWIPSNGIISAGQGTNNATIQWLANGKGYLKVDVINSLGCKDTSSIHVTIGVSGLTAISYENDLFIFPNPAKNEINLKSSAQTLLGSKVIISDITGRVVFDDFIKIHTNLYSIDLSAFNEGLFIITIQKNGEINRLKFVKE